MPKKNAQQIARFFSQLFIFSQQVVFLGKVAYIENMNGKKQMITAKYNYILIKMATMKLKGLIE